MTSSRHANRALAFSGLPRMFATRLMFSRASSSVPPLPPPTISATGIPAFRRGVTSSSPRPPHWMTRSGLSAAIASTFGIQPLPPSATISLSMDAASGNIFLSRPVSKALREPGFMPMRWSDVPSTAITVAAPGWGNVTIRVAGFGRVTSAPVTSLNVMGSASKGVGARARMIAAEEINSFENTGTSEYECCSHVSRI
ncbi:hypothetical protein D3C73_916080 [compost metagenome]